jgi:hypothetical protein
VFGINTRRRLGRRAVGQRTPAPGASHSNRNVHSSSSMKSDPAAGRRLVGDDELRLVHHGAGDGDPLLLAARELVGVAARQLRDPERVERLGGPRPVLLSPGEVLRDAEVVGDRERRDEVRHLRDEPDESTAAPIALTARDRPPFLPVEPHDARGRREQPGDEEQQGGLAAARRAEDHACLALGHRQLRQRDLGAVRETMARTCHLYQGGE